MLNAIIRAILRAIIFRGVAKLVPSKRRGKYRDRNDWE